MKTTFALHVHVLWFVF